MRTQITKVLSVMAACVLLAAAGCSNGDAKKECDHKHKKHECKGEHAKKDSCRCPDSLKGKDHKCPGRTDKKGKCKGHDHKGEKHDAHKGHKH